MSKHRGKQGIGKQDVYDTELHCLKCGTPLYLSAMGVATAQYALKQTGMAGLRCICGHVQVIGPDFKPIWPRPRKLND
jgi:hypothetical protein